MKTVTLSDRNQDEAVATAIEFLQDGAVVLVPTDTAYALAADAVNVQAVERVLELKGRPAEKAAISVVVADRAQAEEFAVFNPEAARLWDTFLPGPLTLVLPVAEKVNLAQPVTDQRRTVGIRHPEYEFCSLVAERLGRPFTATSANRSGELPAYSVEEFLSQLPEDGLAPHLVIDAGSLPIRPVSTVVRVTDTVEVLREGAIPVADIMKAAEEPHE